MYPIRVQQFFCALYFHRNKLLVSIKFTQNNKQRIILATKILIEYSIKYRSFLSTKWKYFTKKVTKQFATLKKTYNCASRTLYYTRV